MTRRLPGHRLAPPVRPSAAIEAEYRKRLQSLIDEMNESCLYWLTARFREPSPVAMAMDASWMSALRATVRGLTKRWTDRFDTLATELSAHFAKKTNDRQTNELRKILRDNGMTVEFKTSPAISAALQGITEENAGLIRSIGSEHLTDIAGIVMRSVNEGSDLGIVSRLLQERFDVPKRRAALIARDQNHKATAAITRLRQNEAGIEKAVWVHSSAGKHPRPEHVAFAAGRLGGPIYDVSKGAYLDGVWTWPGVEINCRCFSRPLIRGF